MFGLSKQRVERALVAGVELVEVLRARAVTPAPFGRPADAADLADHERHAAVGRRDGAIAVARRASPRRPRQNNRPTACGS